MEFVTPEEIAENAVFEIKAEIPPRHHQRPGQCHIVAHLSCGIPFHERDHDDEESGKEHGVDSVAFEILGPPRLSKLLYEAYLSGVASETSVPWRPRLRRS